jgi:hypothetical protein
VPLSATLAEASAVTGGPDGGVKVISLLAGVALKPLPVIEIDRRVDAAPGVTA